MNNQVCFLAHLDQRQYSSVSAAPRSRDINYGLLNMPEGVAFSQLTFIYCVQAKNIRTCSEIFMRDRKVRAT